MPLTGKFAFRRTMLGKIVLRVEEEVKVPWPFSRKGTHRVRWRDANLMDLAEPEMRVIMDMRNGPPQKTDVLHPAIASVRRTKPDGTTVSDLPTRAPGEAGERTFRLKSGL